MHGGGGKGNGKASDTVGEVNGKGMLLHVKTHLGLLTPIGVKHLHYQERQGDRLYPQMLAGTNSEFFGHLEFPQAGP